jgi:Amiloride-sensitive sodium channel
MISTTAWCFYLMSLLVEKFMAKKIVIEFNDKHRHVSEIPYPSFSICPEFSTYMKGWHYQEIIENANNGKVKDLSIQQ